MLFDAMDLMKAHDNHASNQCELISILDGWVNENKFPVAVSKGGWITWDLGKRVIAGFNCTSVALTSMGKIPRANLDIADPRFFDKLHAGIKERIDYLKNRSWLRKWLEDPGD